MAETKQVAKATKPAPPAPSDTDVLLRLALEKDLDVEKLEKLIEMKHREEDRAARLAFDQHFAEMQAEMVPAIRNKAVVDAEGRVKYRYADIEAVQKTIGPIMAVHGFSYRWEEERLDLQPPEKRVWCIISGWGWEKRSYADIPIEQPGKMNNATQMRGVAATYGRRYSLCAAVGVVIEDDDDAQSMGSGELQNYAETTGAIENVQTMDELKQVFSDAYRALEGDERGRRIITDSKNKRKRELMRPDPDPDVPAAKVTIGKPPAGKPTDTLKKLEQEAREAEAQANSNQGEENGELDIY